MAAWPFSDAVTIALVTAVFAFLSSAASGITAVLLAMVARNQSLAAVEVKQVAVAAKQAATKVEEVKTTLDETNTQTAMRFDGLTEQVGGLSTQVEEVHKATNGMKHELVEEVRKASFAKGVKSEADRQTPPG